MKARTILESKTQAISEVCAAVEGDRLAQAVSILRDQYPFKPDPINKRNYGPMRATQVFVRDGFIDRTQVPGSFSPLCCGFFQW